MADICIFNFCLKGPEGTESLTGGASGAEYPTGGDKKFKCLLPPPLHAATAHQYNRTHAQNQFTKPSVQTKMQLNSHTQTSWQNQSTAPRGHMEILQQGSSRIKFSYTSDYLFI